MKCNCSLNNNYEVIGLCDIKKFNQKISKFSDNSWTQVIIPEILTIPDTNPNIESVSRVNININITSYKVIKTPKSEFPNTEGLNLTGKILLVSGCISQTIVYTSCNSHQSIHSVNFKNPFDTYIVIDEDTNEDKDTFCVYPCVENIYIKPVTERSFNKSITLFLFAHRIEPFNCILKNAFILKNLDNDEVVSIHFNICDKILYIGSSGIIYNPNKTTLALIFKLFAPNGSQKIFASIKENETADDFAKKLNNTSFEIGDSIDLSFADKQNLRLTNYPVKGQDYNMIGKNFQSFKITSLGIVENILPNIITLSNSNNLIVLQIKFDFANRILIDSTGELTDSTFAGQQYFKLTLFDNDGVTVKKESFINGNQDGSRIATEFANENYSFKDVIKLEYADSNKVIITKFEGNPVYSPSGTEELYTITEKGLIRYVPKLANTITVKNENNIIIATIEFDKTDNKFIVESTGAMAFSPSTDPYFTLVLYDQNINKKLESTIFTNRSADSFKADIDGMKFTPFFDTLVLIYNDKNQIEITNFPNQGVSYVPNFDANIFEIGNVRLSDNSLSSKVFFRNDAGQEMATIQFANTPRISGLAIATITNAISTQNLTERETYIQLQMVFRNSPFKNTNILGRGTAVNIIELNNTTFNTTRDVIRIAARFPNSAIITNYNRQANYVVTEDSEFLTVQRTDLTPSPIPIYNIIKLKNNNGSYVIKIYFHIRAQRMLVDLIRTNQNLDSDHFIFKLTSADETRVKADAIILSREKGDLFKNVLDGVQFDFGDIVELIYTNGTLVEITDFPNFGQTYNPTGSSEKFSIGNIGLIKA